MLVALPRAVVRTYLENRLLAALPIELELRLDPYGIVTRRHHPLSPGGQAMLQALREASHGAPRAQPSLGQATLSALPTATRFVRDAAGDSTGSRRQRLDAALQKRFEDAAPLACAQYDLALKKEHP
jgi:hypothetical protein